MPQKRITNVGQVNFILEVIEFILGHIQAKKVNYSSADGVFASGETSVRGPGFICTNCLRGKYKCYSIDASSLFFTHTGEWEKVLVCLRTLLSPN